MKVVWAYRNYTGYRMDSGRALCELEAEPLELAALEASVISWIKFAPSVIRVFYADQSVFKILESYNLLRYFDEVKIVDFDQDLDGKYNRLGMFFAYPKIYAMTQQEEPFFLCDTDCVLRENLRNWFTDPTQYYAYYYMDGSTRTPDDATEEELAELSKVAHSSALLRSFCDYSRTINAGLVYYADPKVGQIIGHLILEAGLDIQRTIDRDKPESWRLFWTLYEESLLHNLIEFVGRSKVQEIPLKCFEEFSEGYRDRMHNDSQKVLKDISNACRSPRILKYHTLLK